jgi:hypothetical protein
VIWFLTNDRTAVLTVLENQKNIFKCLDIFTLLLLSHLSCCISDAFLGACKRLYIRLCPLVRPLVRLLVHPLVSPHITLNVVFSAVCGRIDLKFGRDLHIDLLFQFLLFFFLTPPLTPPSPPSPSQKLNLIVINRRIVTLGV